MQSLLFFITLFTNACCIVTVIDFAVELPFGISSKLLSLLNQLCFGYFSWTPESLFDTSKPPKIEQFSIKSANASRKALVEPATRSTDSGTKETQTPPTFTDQRTKLAQLSKICTRFRGPVAKGGVSPQAALCSAHPGATLNCHTFFNHRGHYFKLLKCGKLYVCDSTHTWHLVKDDVPLQPNQPFAVELERFGGVSFLLSFHPSCRILGEINTDTENWELIPIATYCPTGFENDGSMIMEDGQGCAFEQVYSGISPTSLSDEADWACYSADEGLLEPFLSLLASGSDKCTSFPPEHSNPLNGSIHGIYGVANGWPHQDVQVYHTETGQLCIAQPVQPQPPIASPATPNMTTSTSPTTLPTMPATPTGTLLTPPSASPTTSRAIMRRTCTICQRVMRRPSALTIHMNSHYGHKPFKCQACPYGSTNVTNLIRHQRTTGHTDSSSGNN